MGGSGWARIGQLKGRTKNPWIVGTMMPNREERNSIGVAFWDNARHVDCPVIVMQRYMGVEIPDAIAKARSSGQIVINDLDDWFWGLHPENNAYSMVDPLANPKSNIDHYKKSLSNSNVVVVSTQFLADKVTEWDIGSEIVVIGNAVNVDAFPVRKHRPGRIRVGWVGSTGHRSGDLQILRAPFSSLKNVSFHHTGAHTSHVSFASKTGIKNRDLTELPLLAPHEYPYGFTFDVGVVPLVDIPFNHAKSNIKGLEYAAAGIPFVASPLPEYVKLAEEYGIGRIAKSAKDWQNHILELSSVGVRVEEADRQRELVKQFSIKTQAKSWDELVWSLV